MDVYEIHSQNHLDEIMISGFSVPTKVFITDLNIEKIQGNIPNGHIILNGNTIVDYVGGDTTISKMTDSAAIKVASGAFIKEMSMYSKIIEINSYGAVELMKDESFIESVKGATIIYKMKDSAVINYLLELSKVVTKEDYAKILHQAVTPPKKTIASSKKKTFVEPPVSKMSLKEMCDHYFPTTNMVELLSALNHIRQDTIFRIFLQYRDCQKQFAELSASKYLPEHMKKICDKYNQALTDMLIEVENEKGISV